MEGLKDDPHMFPAKQGQAVFVQLGEVLPGHVHCTACRFFEAGDDRHHR